MSHFVKGLVEPIGIIGMGLSGTAVFNLLKFLAPGKSVVTFDAKPGAAQWHILEQMLSETNLKTLIVSPGVPLSTPALVKANAQGLLITSELAVATACLTTEKIIAVTGSVGKSTTVSLLAAATQAFDSHNLAVGNIGKPLAEYVLEVLNGSRVRASWLSLELSSFQLENYENLSADHSVLTFFTSNHLERYHDLKEYYETKWSLVSKTRGSVFVNSQSPELLDFAKSKQHSQVEFCSSDDKNLQNDHLSTSLLLGAHNQQNIGLVASVTHKLGWPQSSIDAIKKFSGLAHRLENLGTLKGISFVNDSKATALDSVLSAVDSLSQTVSNPSTLFLLLGGKDKNLPWNVLSRLKEISNLKIFYFGESAEKAKIGTGLEGPVFPKLGPALDQVFLNVRAGDTLLLSPGGTSHDEFKNFEGRGNFFRKKVLAQFS